MASNEAVLNESAAIARAREEEPESGEESFKAMQSARPADAPPVVGAPNITKAPRKGFLTMRVGETFDEALARAACDPVGKAAVATHWAAAKLFNTPEKFDLDLITELLRERVSEVQRGDMRAADEMLVAQASALDALFHELVRRSTENMGSSFEIVERYMRLALKAQSQSRATWESLSKIKNPPQVMFAKQVNNANGPQQVNNGVGEPHAGARQETESQPIELLEPEHEHGMDARAQGAARGGDPAMEAVGEVLRPENDRRESEVEPQRMEGWAPGDDPSCGSTTSKLTNES